MTVRTWPAAAFGSSLLCLLASCSTGADRYQRDYVSDGLVALNGHGLGPGDGSLPPGVDATDGLGEEEAVATALWNNPTFQAALAELGLRRADLVVAGELPNPWLWFLFPVDAKPIAYNVRIPFESLWQRPGRVAAARFDCERAAQLLMQGGLDLERDVRLAYAELRLARARHTLSVQRAEVQRAIGQFTAQRLGAGDASELEVSVAGAAVARADAEAIRTEQALALAESRVRSLVGDGVPLDVELIEGETELQPPELAEAPPFEVARERRPDLHGAQLALEAAGERVGLSRAQIVQAQLLGDFKYSGAAFQGGPGVFFTVPIFNQGQGGTMRAKADLQQAMLRHHALAQQIDFEVRDAHTRLTTAARLADVCWRALPPLQQAVQRAEQAWQNGDQARLPVLEARLSLLDAKLQDAAARAEVARATAELRRNIGGRLQ